MDAQTELGRAAERGDLEETKRLLASGARPEGTRHDSPLRLAAQRGHTEVIKALLDAYEEPPFEDSRWSSATVDAIQGGHEEAARLLLERARCSDDMLETIAAVAIERGFVDLGLSVVAGGASPNEALREAAEKGLDAAVSQLTGTGRASQEAKEMALFAAATAGRVEAVRALLDAGVSISATDSDGWSAAALAAAEGHDAVLSLLEERGASSRGLLWAAAKRGDEALLSRALSAGQSVTAPSEDGRSALHYAAENGHAGIVQKLLEAGADIEAQDREGKTPAALAAAQGKLDVLTFLADRGASLDRALVEAASSQRAEAVDLCLSRGANVEARDEYAESALHKAAESGDVAIVTRILEKKPKLDRPNINGWTPLMRAAGGGHVEAVRMLLERGAAVNHATEVVYETALSWASNRGHLEVVDALLGAGAQILRRGSYRPLIVAAEEGHTAIVARLLDAGAVIDDAKDETTALSAACRGGHTGTVKLLLDRGATISERAVLGAAEKGNAEVVALLRDKGAKLPADFLHKAAEGGSAGLIALALEAGANVHEKGGYWARTPLAAAANAGAYEAVRLLLDAGSDPNATDEADKSCVRLAQERGATDVVRLLVSRGGRAERKELVAHAGSGDLDAVNALLAEGTNPDVRAELNRTALHEASALGHSEIVKTLLDKGARVDLADEDGWTALMDACDFGHTDIAVTLLDAGADPFHKDRMDYTPFRLAERGGHAEIVKIFREREVDRDYRPEMFQAARDGDVETLRRFADKGRNVTIREAYGGTILHKGAEGGHLDVVLFAFEKGVPLDAPDQYQNTAAYVAGSNGHAKVLKELLDRGAGPNEKDKYGEPLIVNAAARDHAEVVRCLAAAGADLGAKDSEGKSALDKALEYSAGASVLALIELGAPVSEETMEKALSCGNEVARALVARGHKLPGGSADARKLAIELWKEGVDAAFDDPGAAMLEASEYDGVDVVRAFLEHGLDPNVKDDYGKTPLLIAQSNRDKKVVALLKEHGAKAIGTLLELSDSGKTLTAKSIKAALEEGDELEATNGAGKTALHIAAERGSEKSVKALLAAGAKLDALTKEGKSPLLLALDRENLDIARLLEKAGASLSAGADGVWSTAAHYLHLRDIERAKDAVQKGASTKWLVPAAAGSGDLKAIAVAVELGGSADAVMAGGFTAARAAAFTGKEAVLKEVLRLGSPRDGMLHGAVGSEKMALIKQVLAEPGIDVNAKDGWGRTALHEAMFGKPEVAELLLDAGADPNLTDTDGSPPIFYAVEQEGVKLIKLLLSRGASTSLSNKFGQTVFDKAQWRKSAVRDALGISEREDRWGRHRGDGDDED